MTASGIVTFSTAYICGAIMEIPAMDFYMINLVSTIIGYILLFINPANMLIYENHGRLSALILANPEPAAYAICCRCQWH